MAETSMVDSPGIAKANSSTVLPPNTPANRVITAAIRLASGGLYACFHSTSSGANPLETMNFT